MIPTRRLANATSTCFHLMNPISRRLGSSLDATSIALFKLAAICLWASATLSSAAICCAIARSSSVSTRCSSGKSLEPGLERSMRICCVLISASILSITAPLRATASSVFDTPSRVARITTSSCIWRYSRRDSAIALSAAVISTIVMVSFIDATKRLRLHRMRRTLITPRMILFLLRHVDIATFCARLSILATGTKPTRVAKGAASSGVATMHHRGELASWPFKTGCTNIEALLGCGP